MQQFQAKGGVQTPSITINNTLGDAGGKIEFMAPSEETVTIQKKNTTIKVSTPSVPSQVTKTPMFTTGLVNARNVYYADGETIVAGTQFLGFSSDLSIMTRNTNSSFTGASFRPNRVSKPMPSLWVMGTENGLFTSSDGTTWSARTVPNTNQYFECVRFYGRLFVACTGGVMRSEDNGSTWKFIQIPEASGNMTAICTNVNSAGNSTIMAVGSDSGKLFYTTDYTGESWQSGNTDPNFFTMNVDKLVFFKNEFYLYDVRMSLLYSTTDFITYQARRSFSGGGQLTATKSYICVTGPDSRVSYMSSNDRWDYIQLTEIAAQGGYVNSTCVVDDDTILVLSATGVVYKVDIGTQESTLLIADKTGVMISASQSANPASLTRKDYVDGEIAKLSLGSSGSVLAEIEKNYLKLAGGTLTGDTHFNAGLIVDSASPVIDYKVSGKTKYRTGVIGDNYAFGTDAPPSTFAALSAPTGAAGKVMFDMTTFNDTLYIVGVQTLAKSTNGGQTWTNFTLPGMPVNSDYLGCFVVDDYIFILGIDKSTGSGARFYSKDGIAWSRLANPAGSRNYDNPIIMRKLAMGKYVIAGLGFVSVANAILGPYTRYEWHSNTPAVTRYCHAISEHGDRIVAHVPDSSTGLPRAYVSDDKGATWSIRAYTGDTPSGQIMGCGQINSVWYLVDVSGSLFTTADGVALTKVISKPDGVFVRFAASVFDDNRNAIVIGDNSGTVSFTDDFTTWNTYNVGFDIRTIRNIPGDVDSFYIASQVGQVGRVKLQYSGAPFSVTPYGPITNRLQQDLPNSLARKDYVDAVAFNTVSKDTLKGYLPLTGGELSGNLAINSERLVIENANGTLDFTTTGSRVMALVSNGTVATPSLSVRTNDIPVTTELKSTTGRQIGFIDKIGDVWYTTSFKADGYIRQSVNEGALWTSIPGITVAGTNSFTNIVFVNDTLFACAYDGITWYNTNNTTWKRATLPDTFATLGVIYYKNVYYAPAGKGVLRSTNPATWTRAYTSANAGTMYDIAVTPDDTLFAYGHLITATSTDGTTWTPSSFWANKHLVSAFSFKGKLYVTEYDSNKMYVNNDSSYTTWTEVSLYPGNRVNRQTQVIVNGVAYFADAVTGRIYSTEDFNTFKEYTVFAANTTCARLIHITKNQFYYCTGGNGGIYVVDLGSPALVPLQVTKDGAFTNVEQSTLGNSFTRKDYVDTEIQNIELKMEARNYLPLAGGTITGKVVVNVPDTAGLGSYALNLSGTAIGGLKALTFKDAAGVSDGIFFPKTGNHDNADRVVDYDVIKALDGQLLLNNKKVYGEWNKPTADDIGLTLTRMFMFRDSSRDLDKDILPGHYHITNDAANRPVTESLFGHMLVTGGGTVASGSWFQQTFYGHSAPFRIWTRRNVNGTFSPWKRIYTEDDPITAKELGINADGLNPDLYYTKSQVYSTDQVDLKLTALSTKFDTNGDGIVDKAQLANGVTGITETGYPSYYGKDLNGVVGFHAFTPRTKDDTLNQQYNIPAAKANTPVRITLESPTLLMNSIIQCYKTMPGLLNVVETLEKYNADMALRYYIESDNLELSDSGVSIKLNHVYAVSSGPTTGTFISDEITPATFQQITSIL